MAAPLTLAERVQIRSYLGWSERFHSTDNRLELAFGALDTDSEALDYIRAEAAKVQVIEDKIQDMTTRFKAAKVGSIELQGAMELALLRQLGGMSIGRIATSLGVEVRGDYFRPGGPGGMATRHGVFPSGLAGDSNFLRQG